MISVLVALSIRESKPSIKHEARVEWKWKDLPHPFKNYIVTWTLFSLANSSDVFLILKVKQAGGSLRLTILLYVFYNLLYALLSRYFGKKSDQIPREKVLFFGLIIFSLVYLGFSMATQIWQYWFLFGLYGIYMAATDGVGKALAVDLFDPKLKATAIGILGVTTGIATIVASTIAGVLWDHCGSHWTFFYSAFGALLAAVMLNFTFKRSIN